MRSILTACAVAGLLALLGSQEAAAQEADLAAGTLRVCSDPDNMPFSNSREEGFENRIAGLLAADLGLKVEYAWGALYRGFVRKTLQADECDVIMGVPAGSGKVKTTRPYYRSAYVIVGRSGDAAAPEDFDDPRLADARIGLPAIGMEGANTPPALSLALRGLAPQIVGYTVWGDSDSPEPQKQMFADLAAGTIDYALAWGPVAGYYAKDYGKGLTITQLRADPRMPAIPFGYAIAVATRKQDGRLRDLLQGALDRQAGRIADILAEYGIPVFADPHRDS